MPPPLWRWQVLGALVRMTLRESPGTAVTLTLATVGLGLNLRASILLGPHLHDRFGARPGTYAILVGLPLLVAALVRLPAGVLTDRYGARVTFPAVSLAAAAAVIGAGWAGSLPALVVAGAAAGRSEPSDSGWRSPVACRRCPGGSTSAAGRRRWYSAAC